MQFWRDRYIYPGWFFVGSLFLLSRFLPTPVTLLLRKDSGFLFDNAKIAQI